MNDDYANHLGEISKITIDRPLGSKDIKDDHICLTNCGTVDGKDAYLLGVFEPVEEYEGRLIGIIYRENENESESLVVAPKTYTADQITALIEFRECNRHSWVAYTYDKPYWPEEFNTDMPEIRKALQTIKNSGKFNSSEMQTALQKGRGYIIKLEAWLKDNGLLKEAR